MKKICVGVYAVFMLLKPQAQEIPEGSEQQLEQQAESGVNDEDDDQWLQDLDFFRKHPLDINGAGAAELRRLRILNEIQISSFLAYRMLLGKLQSVYELQAVPYWDLPVIRKILPLIRLSAVQTLREDLLSRLQKGEHSVLIRASSLLEKSAGFDRNRSGNRYLGNPMKWMFRYRYAYKNLLQYGVLGEKDAGEPFLKGAQRTGFDFYSFHLFVRQAGPLKVLALGDFTVCMGQGLVQWQGFSPGRGGDITGVKRQQEVLRPYSSAGEFNFHRGAAMGFERGKLQISWFISFRNLSANKVLDSSGSAAHVTSLLSAGYHRTASEIADRNSLRLFTAGAVVRYNYPNGHIAFNTVQHQTDVPILKREEPYNFFAAQGRQWLNGSVDYAFTYRNAHFFGELAASRIAAGAWVQGVLLSVDPRVDISLLYRVLSPAYQALFGQSFTAQGSPGNEKGFFAGFSLRPDERWKLDASADFYHFPWLTFNRDAPARGVDYRFQLAYRPSRQTEIRARYRFDAAESNVEAGVMPRTGFIMKRGFRFQFNQVLSPGYSIRIRAETTQYRPKGAKPRAGYLLYTDILAKPVNWPVSGTVRMQYFETEGYDTRIYAFENDVLYSYSLPAYSGRGYRYYLILHGKLSRKWEGWLRWAQNIYPGSGEIGTGLDQVAGNKKSEWKFQVRYIF